MSDQLIGKDDQIENSNDFLEANKLLKD